MRSTESLVGLPHDDRSSRTARLGTSGNGTRTPCWYPTMISKLDRCEREKISSPPRSVSEFFNEKKDDKTLTSRSTRERAKDHSMKHREQTWTGTAQIGDPTCRKLPLHELHNKGGNTSTKTLNSKINTGGDSDAYRLFQSRVDFFADIAYRHQRMSCTRREVNTEHLVARTIFLCRALDHRSSHAAACGSSFGMCCTFAHLKSHPLTTCFIHNSPMCLNPFLPLCSTPPSTSQTPLPVPGIRRSPCATPHGVFSVWPPGRT